MPMNNKRPVFTKSSDPCMNCEERWIDLEQAKTCHSECERYIAAKEKDWQRKQMIRENTKADYIVRDYTAQGVKTQKPRRYR